MVKGVPSASRSTAKGHDKTSKSDELGMRVGLSSTVVNAAQKVEMLSIRNRDWSSVKLTRQPVDYLSSIERIFNFEHSTLCCWLLHSLYW